MPDWAIEEFINTVEAHGRGARVAGLEGFGYSRSSLGLMDHFFLITQLLSNHIDGRTWIRAHPQAVEQLIETAFELLSSLHAKNVVHMDLVGRKYYVAPGWPGGSAGGRSGEQFFDPHSLF